MKLESIQDEWERDCRIDRSDLVYESLRGPDLHIKYHRMLSHERLVLRGYEAEMKTLKTDKYEFLTQGHTPETKARGWRLPAKGPLLKQEVAVYLESDKDIIELGLRISMADEKVQFLKSIMDSISNRRWEIRNAIQTLEYEAGLRG